MTYQTEILDNVIGLGDFLDKRVHISVDRIGIGHHMDDL